MDTKLIALLEKKGWEIQCYSPLEIRHKETGSFAISKAAEMVVSYIRDMAAMFGEYVNVRGVFQVGDRVKCIDPNDSQIQLEMGKVYTVSEITVNHSRPYVFLEGCERWRQGEWRFVKEKS